MILGITLIISTSLLVAIILSAILLCCMFWPYQETGWIDLTTIIRTLYLIPLLFVWLIYFIIN
jgi:hypothetical protein